MAEITRRGGRRKRGLALTIEFVKIMRMHRPVIWLPLLCVGLIYFIWRGPVRAFRTTGNFDFLVVHNAVQTYQDGENPYVQEEVLHAAEAHGRRWRLHELLNARLLYAPGFLTVFAPMGWLGDGPGGTAIWIVLQFLAFAGLAAACAHLCGLDRALWPIFGAFSLFWAPVHTNIALGQPSIVFALFTAVFLLYLKTNRDGLNIFALGLLFIKPSLAAPSAVVAAFHRKWKVLALGCAVGVALCAPFLLRYGPVESVDSYGSAITAVSQPGGDADDSRQNPFRFDLINLRSWLYAWELPAVLTELLNGAYLGFLCTILYRYRGTARDGPSQGVYWTLAAVFICLALYHRFYDAALLLVAVAAALALHRSQPRRAGAMAVLLLPFTVPGTAFLGLAIGDHAASSPWIEALIVRHQVLALIVLGLCCAWWLRQGAKAAAVDAGPSVPLNPHAIKGA